MKGLIQSNIPKDQLLFIKFKDLISHTENTLKIICAFLEVPLMPPILTNNNENEKNLLLSLEKNPRFTSELKKSFKEIHLKSLEKIDKEIIKNQKTDVVFSKNQLNKINLICSKTAKEYEYDCPHNKISLNLSDKFQILLAEYDFFISKKYLLLPVKYKKLLRSLNIFNFYR